MALCLFVGTQRVASAEHTKQIIPSLAEGLGVGLIGVDLIGGGLS